MTASPLRESRLPVGSSAKMISGLLASARAQATRYAALFKEGVVSREQYDQVTTAADALKQAVEADRAAVEMALWDLNGRALGVPVHRAPAVVAARVVPAVSRTTVDAPREIPVATTVWTTSPL